MKKYILALTGLALAACAYLAQGDQLVVPKTDYVYDNEDTNAWYFDKLTPNVYSFGTSSATNVPGTLTNAMQVSAGQTHCLALTSNNTVVAWGNNLYGQTTIPAGLDQPSVTKVLAGNNMSACLLNDGTVFYWGRLGITTNATGSIVSNAVPFASITYGGSNEVIGVLADGGLLGFSDTGFTNYPTMSNVVEVASTSAHHLVRFADGSVTNWGWSATGLPAAATNAVSIAITTGQNMIVRGDGTVLYWNPASPGTGTVKAATNSIVGGSGANGLALKLNATNGLWQPINYIGSLSIPPNPPGLTSLSVGSGFAVGIRQ